MLKETVFIEAPLEEAWDRFELEFAKLFKCSPKKNASSRNEGKG
ncbi:hypothetical protein K210_00085 [Erysipelothrix rhusiopathiae SY1027]|nr:hypothetical protein [Erysipelothrix rhusiopathiae]AGN23658.1 hypothetical protein K210_00085 [Erysipelothrix rhusiopathiae SY1027]